VVDANPGHHPTRTGNFSRAYTRARARLDSPPGPPVAVVGNFRGPITAGIEMTTHGVISRRASAACNCFSATMCDMGRRSRGPRELLGTRLAPAEAKRYRDLAEEHGLSISDFIAELLRISVRHIDELPAPALDQEELPLSQAS
jgi:hypothetical protein